MRTFFIALTILSFSFTANSACWWFSKNCLQEVSISASQDVNEWQGLELDLVFVSDKKIAKIISGMNYYDWFNQKPIYMMMHPESVSVQNFQIVPHSTVTAKMPKSSKSAYTVMAFGNYMSHGVHEFDLTLHKKVEIKLKQTSMELNIIK